MILPIQRANRDERGRIHTQQYELDPATPTAKRFEIGGFADPILRRSEIRVPFDPPLVEIGERERCVSLT